MMEQKKLTRSANKILAGVCGGIAEYFDVDPTLVRVCYAALSIFTTGFPGVLLYIIMMLLMPRSDYEQLN
ncbi:MAG: PspC domain-containing protein [Paludibacteraceae bacterium]|nr:PspC domain-containing protein [Paludibacteraceae bacterium]MBR0309895.1 PspC domain-containing protein [Paludibacteraceae bacterium]